jgi:hypothetical protein
MGKEETPADLAYRTVSLDELVAFVVRDLVAEKKRPVEEFLRSTRPHMNVQVTYGSNDHVETVAGEIENRFAPMCECMPNGIVLRVAEKPVLIPYGQLIRYEIK